MKLIFLGPPGAGKGTQAKRLASEFRVAHISTGDMLRAAVSAGSDLGKQVQATIDSGQLVSDDLMLELIKARTLETDCANGYILDGFPRTTAQAEALTKMLAERSEQTPSVLLIEVSEADVKARLQDRLAKEGRADDDVNVQLERLRVYQKQTAPLIQYYRERNNLSVIEGTGTVDEVYQRLTTAVSSKK